MRALLSALGAVAAASLCHAQSTVQDTLLTRDSADSLHLRWDAIEDRTYLVQFSDDLIQWHYFPTVMLGVPLVPELGMDFTLNTDRLFFRVRYIDPPFAASGVDWRYWDHDADGLPTLTEVMALDLDPFNATSGDGVHLDGALDKDGDGFSNGLESERGTDPNDDQDRPQPILTLTNAQRRVQIQHFWLTNIVDALGDSWPDGNVWFSNQWVDGTPVQETVDFSAPDLHSLTTALVFDPGFPNKPGSDPWAQQQSFVLGPHPAEDEYETTYDSTLAVTERLDRKYRLEAEWPVEETTTRSYLPVLTQGTYTLDPDGGWPLEESSGTFATSESTAYGPAIEFTIPQGQTISNEEEIVAPAVGTGFHAARVDLLPVDLDIVHPATGELDEGKQHDQTQGGLVAVKRGDFTKPVRDEPVTELVIRANTAIQGLKWKLKFNGGTNFKIWKDLARTQAVVSEQTEFDPSQDVKLYFEGLKKSASVGEHNVKLMAVINGSSVEADTVYFTVVEAQVLVQVRYWIREGWIDIPWHPLVNPVPNYAIAGGDRRDNSFEWEPGKGTPPLTTAPGYRVAQEIVIQPFKELNPTGLTPGSRTGSAENKSGITSLFHKPSSVPLWALPWAPGVNDLFPTATPTGVAPPPTNRMHIDSSRDGDRKGKVRFHGAASDPLVPGAFDIDWDLNITIDAADPLQLKYEIEGFHDDYPAVEVNMKFDAKDPSPTTTPFTTSPQPYFWLHPLPSDPFALGNGVQIDISPAKKGDVK